MVSLRGVFPAFSPSRNSRDTERAVMLWTCSEGMLRLMIPTLPQYDPDLNRDHGFTMTLTVNMTIMMVMIMTLVMTMTMTIAMVICLINCSRVA